MDEVINETDKFNSLIKNYTVELCRFDYNGFLGFKDILSDLYFLDQANNDNVFDMANKLYELEKIVRRIYKKDFYKFITEFMKWSETKTKYMLAIGSKVIHGGFIKNYDRYSYSQLIEMLPCCNLEYKWILVNIDPDMTCRQIRDVVKSKIKQTTSDEKDKTDDVFDDSEDSANERTVTITKLKRVVCEAVEKFKYARQDVNIVFSDMLERLDIDTDGVIDLDNYLSEDQEKRNVAEIQKPLDKYYAVKYMVGEFVYGQTPAKNWRKTEITNISIYTNNYVYHTKNGRAYSELELMSEEEYQNYLLESVDDGKKAI